MNLFRHTVRALIVTTFLFGLCAVAQAQLRVFVASTGSDVNACTRTAPCRNFQRAHDVAAAGGEIVALDAAGYGSVSITKAITINGTEVYAGITVGAGGTGVTVAAGSGVVILRNLKITGNNAGTNTGISHTSGKLVVEGCDIGYLATGVSITNAKADFINCDLHNNSTVAYDVTGPGTEGTGGPTPSVTQLRVNRGNVTFNGIGFRSNGRGYNAGNQDLHNTFIFSYSNTPDLNVAGNTTNFFCTDPNSGANNPCDPRPPTYNWTTTLN